jgi:hypothetical protein
VSSRGLTRNGSASTGAACPKKMSFVEGPNKNGPNVN